MVAQVHVKPLLPMPTSEAELELCLADPEWRLFSGCLYKIMIKGDDGEDSFSIPFKPNRAQRRFIKRLWHRNLILKARQLGFTTLIAILWLDHAIFNADQRCGIIAQDKEAAELIFRDKVKYAYENLPEEIRERFPLGKDSATELLFAHNNSSVRVATSMRSGTIHRLHISEFGKICAKYPQKAEEVMTGSIPAVPTNGILVIESTAEGPYGDFYKLAKKSQAHHYTKAIETPRDYRFHFYAWWQEPKYVMDSTLVPITLQEHEYFDDIEAAMGCTIDAEQRAWYTATKNADFEGNEERMWQEYPSTPDEAFQQSTEGHYLSKQITHIVKRGGFCSVPVLDMPVYTFWDIGNTDGTAIWFAQSLRGEDRFIGYYEEHNEDLRHYAIHLQSRGFIYGGHFLPHDANHKRLGDYNRSTMEQMQLLLPGQKFIIVPRVTELIAGVNTLRKHMKSAWFDEKACGQGIERLRGYKKKYSKSLKKFTDEPDKANGCSEGADGLRQWAQAKEIGLYKPSDDNYGSINERHDEEHEPADWRM